MCQIPDKEICPELNSGTKCKNAVHIAKENTGVQSAVALPGVALDFLTKQVKVPCHGIRFINYQRETL